EIGSFHNRTNVSDITIEKRTVDGKAGKFKVHVKFDNGFTPRYVVYSPASTAAFSQVGGEEGTWEFTIEEGQRLTIKDVPLYTTYTISEPAQANGWELVSIADKDGNTSTDKQQKKKITTRTPDGQAFNPDYVHTVTNRFTEVLLDKVVAKGDQKKKFDFTVQVTAQGLEAGEEITYGWMNEEDSRAFFQAQADANGAAVGTMTVQLAHGEDIALVVPYGAQVDITETNGVYDVAWKIGGGASGNTSKADTVQANKDKQTITFTNTLELVPETTTRKVTRTITYTEKTPEGTTVAVTKKQTVSLKKTIYKGKDGNYFDEDGNRISGFDDIPWKIDDSVAENDTGAVTSPDHKDKASGWNPDITVVGAWEIDLNDPKDEVIHVIYTQKKEEKPAPDKPSKPSAPQTVTGWEPIPGTEPVAAPPAQENPAAAATGDDSLMLWWGLSLAVSTMTMLVYGVKKRGSKEG
ncbi:MAG: hypothetical protein J5935_07505, partial [Lachnospiraceae bacterium]|nr:hypothetical protein [Lachnospiraceae bacterium]